MFHMYDVQPWMVSWIDCYLDMACYADRYQAIVDTASYNVCTSYGRVPTVMKFLEKFWN